MKIDFPLIQFDSQLRIDNEINTFTISLLPKKIHCTLYSRENSNIPGIHMQSEVNA